MFNPYNQASLNLSVTQNLLKGFGPSINNRYHPHGQEQLRISDLTFKQQVIATVASVVSLYWDLVSYNEALKVDQQTLELDTSYMKTTSAAPTGGHRAHRHHPGRSRNEEPASRT